jgi:serine/threonine-protein kinase
MGSKDVINQPVHTVYLDAFWIDQTDVTNAMYAKCVSAGICKPSEGFATDLMEDKKPELVDWSQANTYCKWAGRSLPTEAQWEKAARGTDGRTYPWGNQAPNKSLLNYNHEMETTTDVGSYPSGASPYGALDMAGNVFQWVADWYDANYYGKSPKNNPTGPTSGTERVMRGGSWGSNGDDTRSARRSSTDPEGSSMSSGFRCALRATAPNN